MAGAAERLAAWQASRESAGGDPGVGVSGPEGGVPTAAPAGGVAPVGGTGAAERLRAFGAARARQGTATNSLLDYRGGDLQRTLDGDTLELSRGTKRRESVRLDGIDAPESAQGVYGPAAHAFLDEMVKQHGKLRVGSQTKDRYGREVSTLYAGDKNLNVEMVRAGHAKMVERYAGGLSKKMRQELADAQREAQEAQVGIWAPGVELEDAETYRHRVGQDKMALGHDNRAPADPTTLTRQQVLGQWLAQRQGGGAAAAGGRPRDPAGALAASRARAYIASDERYQPEEGWLEHALGALDYAGNIVRSGLHGGLQKGGGLARALEYAGQAAAKERKTTGTRLKDTLTEAGLGIKVRYGKDDGEFQIGDIGDFWTDFAVDFWTDPVNLASMGAGAVLRKVGKFARGAVDLGLGVKSADAAAYQAAKRMTGAAIGATYGAGTVDKDDDLGEKLLAVGLGGALGYVAPTGLDRAGAFFKTNFNDASDWYARWTRGSKFENFTEARDVANKAYDRVRDTAEWIKQGRFEALNDLKDPADRLRVTDIMQRLKSEYLRRRGFLEHSLKFNEMPDGDVLKNQMSNRINRAVADGIEKDFLPKILEQEKIEIANAVHWWGLKNQETIGRLNELAYGLKSGAPEMSAELKTAAMRKMRQRGLGRGLRGAELDSWVDKHVAREVGDKGIQGIPWHVDDVYERRDLLDLGKEAEEAFGKFTIEKATKFERSAAPQQLAGGEFQKAFGKQFDKATATPAEKVAYDKLLMQAQDKTYGIYAERFAHKFLTDTERKAVSFMNEYAKTSAKQAPMRAIETGLDYLDKVTSFIKGNMLFFSMTWLKNNMFDNMGKSFIENGIQGALDSATLGKFHKGVFEDVRQLYKGNLNRVYAADDMQDMLKRGVLDNPMFAAMADKTSQALLFRPQQIADKDNASAIERAVRAWQSNPYMQAVAGLGSLMEGTARAMTYVRTKEALQKLPAFAGADAATMSRVKDLAAKLVKETFFDYGDVTHFERAVFQRMVPFYSFYSKNFPYWLKAATDPERAGRVLALEKVRHNIGEDPSSYDKSGLSPYLIESAPRKLGVDARGNTKYVIQPGTSMHDAVQMLNPAKWLQQLVDKGNPIPKLAYEFLSGNDLFDGGKLVPSQIAKDEAAQHGRAPTETDGKKFLFSRGFKHYAVKQAMEAMGLDWLNVLSNGVEVDKNGNPYTTSDTNVYVDKLLQVFFPMGVVDQLAGSIGKTINGKEDLDEAIANRMLPAQTVKVSPAFARMVRQRKMLKKEVGGGASD